MNELTSHAMAPAMIASSTMPTGPRRCNSDGRSVAVGAVSITVSSRFTTVATGGGAATAATGSERVDFATGATGAGGADGALAGAGTVPLPERGSGAGRIAGRGVALGCTTGCLGSGGRGGICALGRRTTGPDAANGRSASITSWQFA